ncbi:MAG: hypothetical protein WCQ72_03490, partial [Eubacteriales bacterium]
MDNADDNAGAGTRAAVMPVFLMFAAALLTAVITAALCCSDINSRSDDNFELRTAVNYTLNSVRAAVRTEVSDGSLAVY